jgi:uncharacterized protein (TIGR03435 family)
MPLISALFCLPLHSQTAAPELTSFEVASIKPSAPVSPMRVGSRGGPGTKDPTRFIADNLSLLNLILRAYNLKRWQLSGPDWLVTARFNVNATIAEGATRDQFRLMLQNLLIERFQLKVHHESKEMAVYNLTVARNGPKLKESAKDPPAKTNEPAKLDAQGLPIGQSGMTYSAGRLRSRSIEETMDEFARDLSNQLGGPVHNATGLTGKYDFDLDWAPGESVRATPPPELQHGGTLPVESDGESGPTIFEAVRTQLGLSLERKKGQVDVLVVDKIERRPSEN